MNDFFRSLLDEDAGKKLLESTIVALRKISVVNNDLPARLGDVIGFFCTLPDPSVIGGAAANDLRLNQVRNRLSMSVVYDSLWIWRKHFQIEDSTRSDKPQDPEDKYPSHMLIYYTDNKCTHVIWFRGHSNFNQIQPCGKLCWTS
jgi:transcriptional regulatory protein LEU3